MKEYLYCVPYDKALPLRKDGIKYHCEKDTLNENNKKDNTKYICDVCNKVFKDTRCLKIHKTKMNHHSEDKSANKSSKRGRSISPPSPHPPLSPRSPRSPRSPPRHNKKILKV